MPATEDKKFRPTKITVQRAVSFQEGRLKSNVNFGIVIDIIDEDALAMAKAYGMDFCRTSIEQELSSAGKIVRTERFDVNLERIKYTPAQGPKGPFELASGDDEETTKLLEYVSSHPMFEYNGYTYWVMKDGKTVGRRKIV